MLANPRFSSFVPAALALLLAACAARPALPPDAAYVGRCKRGVCTFTMDARMLRSSQPVALTTGAECTESDRCATERIGLLTDKARQRLLAAAETLAELELPERIGCPGCADGPVTTLQLTHADGALTRHAYESGESQLPAPLATADRLLENVWKNVNECASNDLVTVLEPCAR